MFATSSQHGGIPKYEIIVRVCFSRVCENLERTPSNSRAHIAESTQQKHAYIINIYIYQYLFYRFLVYSPDVSSHISLFVEAWVKVCKKGESSIDFEGTQEFFRRVAAASQSLFFHNLRCKGGPLEIGPHLHI